MADVDRRIAPHPSDLVVDKTGYSAFHETGLHALLQSRGIRHLAITGLTTSQCVNSSARAASDYGYTTLMVEDAQADYEASDHRAALYASEAITGQVVTTEEMLRLLT
jgi:nicotinamidase-related amidase